MPSITRHTHERLQVVIGVTAQDAGAQAAADFAQQVRTVLAGAERCVVYLAGALSQQAFHQALARRKDLDWHRVIIFAVDEFYAPGMDLNLAVAAQPARDLLPFIKPLAAHRLDPHAPDPHAEAQRYAALVRTHPADIACLGIGESGHLAFNEPGCDLGDLEPVRVIDVCASSRRQLETDPNFAALGNIPDQGITMTIPTLLRARFVLVNVPYASKAAIIRQFVETPHPTPSLPASALKTHGQACLYLDRQSAQLTPWAADGTAA